MRASTRHRFASRSANAIRVDPRNFCVLGREAPGIKWNRSNPQCALRCRIQKMPSGDAQRTWFPEMITRLRSNWHEGMSMPALISLRDELDEMLQCIRAGRNIRTPIITCRKCGMTGPAAPPHVSVRALILAVSRFGIVSSEKTRVLEKDWARYRKKSWTHRRGKSPSRDAGDLSALRLARGILEPLRQATLGDRSSSHGRG